MNWFDITIGIFLLLAFINGYRKGLIMQLIGLAGILLAIIFGGKFASVILPHLDRTFDWSPQVLHVLSYALAFVAIALVASLAGQIIERIINIIFLSFFNRILGGVTGVAIAMIVFSLLLNLLLVFDKDEQIIGARIRNNSFFFERIEAVVPTIAPYLNKELWDEYIPEINNSKSEDLHYQVI
jgi:membrane protein required for colicin V production